MGIHAHHLKAPMRRPPWRLLLRNSTVSSGSRSGSLIIQLIERTAMALKEVQHRPIRLPKLNVG